MPDESVATTEQVSNGPTRLDLDPSNPHTRLQRGIKAALQALPGEFNFQHPVGGVNATDLFNLNTFLGAGIEMEVVRTLNALRTIWDPDSEWDTFRFERSSQAFPDVRLVNRGVGDEKIALGIELKGWWMLAKEGVPSLRYQVAPDACAPHDLVCVVPWHLSSAVSGVAVVAEPWVESARYAAEWRDYWWTNVRTTKGDSTLRYPESAHPYPEKADRVSVSAVDDSGDNFGRLPRYRPLMDDFLSATMSVPILGIETAAWVRFLKLHTDTTEPDLVIERLQRKLRSQDRKISPELAEKIFVLLNDLKGLLP